MTRQRIKTIKKGKDITKKLSRQMRWQIRNPEKVKKYQRKYKWKLKLKKDDQSKAKPRHSNNS